jgi:hypothetical protein
VIWFFNGEDRPVGEMKLEVLGFFIGFTMIVTVILLTVCDLLVLLASAFIDPRDINFYVSIHRDTGNLGSHCTCSWSDKGTIKIASGAAGHA